MSTRLDPCFCCVLCGVELALFHGEELAKAHEPWAAWKARKSNKKKSLILPAAELEHMDLEMELPLWSVFYRAILDDPTTGCLSISGISPYIVRREIPDPVMNDPDKAVVFPGIVKTRHKWSVDFHMVNLFETDRNRANGERVGYTMHPHCWLLVDRFLGHDIVKQDLRAFVQAIEAYWRADSTLWMPDLSHDTFEYPCYDNAAPFIRQNCPGYPPDTFNRIHVSESPLFIRDIQALIARATQEHEKHINRAPKLRSHVPNVPTEIIIMAVDAIWQSRPPCHERIQDIRNVTEVFQWKLPDPYWQRRCDPDLVFEVQDVIKAGTQIDWVCFCLGLHELLLQENWYCNSGLYVRGRVLHLVECIKENVLRSSAVTAQVSKN